MTDDPNKLKEVLLEQADTEQQRQFAKMLGEQCAEADLRAKGHQCWCFIPNAKEYAIMAKYAENDQCPKCKKGRIILEIFHGNIGESYWLKCRWGDKDCGFKESATDLSDF